MGREENVKVFQDTEKMCIVHTSFLNIYDEALEAREKLTGNIKVLEKELEEIERQQRVKEESQYEIDYDEYEEYYDEDNN